MKIKIDYKMKLKVILAILAISVFLVGCGSEEQESTGTKELIFLEKSMDYVAPSIIFESEEDQKYYLVEVNDYLYNELEFEEGEVITLDSRNSNKLGIIGKFTFNSRFGNNFEEPKEKVFLFDKWRSLFPTKNYLKED